MYPKVTVQNFGSFEYAELELRPLTILIGKNSVGKSMLVYPVWTLASTMPDFEKLAEIVEEHGVEEIATRIVRALEKGGKNPHDDFRRLVELHIEALHEAIASGVGEALKETFATELRDLILENRQRALIKVREAKAMLTLVIEEDRVYVNNYVPYREFIENLHIKIPAPGRLKIVIPHEEPLDFYVAGVGDLVQLIVRLLAIYVRKAFNMFFTTESVAALLVDGRAGIARTLLRPYPSPRVVKGITYLDEYFVRLYYRLAEMLYHNLIHIDLVEDILRELGCKIEPVFERGTYTIYIQTWTGKRVPFEKAPSGIRETLVAALALASGGNPYVVFIEEPEAHLHPRAQRLLTRLIARAINELGKIVVITTHSDYIVYSLSNLIALSSSREKARQLSYTESEILEPSKVAAYIVKPSEGKAVVERLEVAQEGIPEDEFAEIARVLADERAYILT